MFGNLSNQGLEKQEDRLGGGRQLLSTDVYDMDIVAVYVTRTKSHGMNINLILKDVATGQEYRETAFVATAVDGNPENLRNYFEKDGKKQPYPGYTLINDICRLTLEKYLHQLTPEARTFKLWNTEEGKELPTEVPTIVELSGQRIKVAIQHIRQNKQALNESTKKYENTEEAVEINSINKVFHHTFGVTLVEAEEGKTEPEFLNKWLEKHKGNMWDKYKEVKPTGGRSGAPALGGASATQTGGTAAPSLFGGK